MRDGLYHHLHVALLAEGVDRNPLAAQRSAFWNVALLAEGVDRNSLVSLPYWLLNKSPSSRRAWIEILKDTDHSMDSTNVALLAEGVDRNHKPSLWCILLCSRPPRGGRG